MNLVNIKLPRGQWKYNPSEPLGAAGGFGEVFAGQGEGEGEAQLNLAIKKLHLDAREAAHREMTVCEDLFNRELKFIVPIYDAGLDANTDSYFVVMARAEGNLEDYINYNGIQAQVEAVHIMIDIAHGLQEVIDLVHRDLKPGNVLFHNGAWKIADFGIARFLEESTSLQTLKGCLSPDYAAPEQWRYERATNATDVYALGCIGHTLLTGEPPFSGTLEELREAHLNLVPKRLPAEVYPKFSSLISMMLRKQRSVRPDIGRVLEILESIKEGYQGSGGSPAYEELVKAGNGVEQIRSERETHELEERSKREARNNLALAGQEIFGNLVDELFSFIEKAAPNAIRRNSSTIILGKGKLSIITTERIFPIGTFERSGWNVLSGAIIQVTQENPPYSPSSALWYMDPNGGENYRWHEVSYWNMAFSSKGTKYDEPNACINFVDADFAAAPIVHSVNIAFGPKLIDDENAEDFFERWMSIFARAAEGKLRKPSQFPLKGNL